MAMRASAIKRGSGIQLRIDGDALAEMAPFLTPVLEEAVTPWRDAARAAMCVCGYGMANIAWLAQEQNLQRWTNHWGRGDVGVTPSPLMISVPRVAAGRARCPPR